MSAPVLIENYKKLREKPTWKLLAADTAPETIAVLQTLLFDGERRVKESVLIERAMRLYNEKETQSYSREMILAKLNIWRKERFITREFTDRDEEPMCELTPDAFDAISFVSSLTEQRVSPTTSRLELLLYAIRKLVDDTDKDTGKRLARLQREKAQIDEKIKDLKAGKMDLPNDIEVKSQIQDILGLLEKLEGDFLRVRDRLISLANEIQATLLAEDNSVDTALASFFKGYDAIRDSEEGKTFESFYHFLSREIAAHEVDSLFGELETREFWPDLKQKDSEALLDLVSNLNARSRLTLHVMKRLAAGLRQLVQDRNYLEKRRLKQLLREARLLSVKAVKEGVVDINSEIASYDATFVRLLSPSGGKLYDPAERRTSEEVKYSDPITFNEQDLALKLLSSEIDFRYLNETIKEALQNASVVSLGELLRRFPPKQGLGTIIGYIYLAKREGECVETQKEAVRWTNRLGEEVTSEIPLFLFSADHFLDQME